MMFSREVFVDQIKHYIGAETGNAMHHHIVDTYNKFVSQGKSKGSKYIVKYDDSWCATTVSAAAIECGYTDIIFAECSCTRQIKLFRQYGIYDDNDNRVPSVGEIVYYNWKAQTSPTDVANHVGVVIAVDTAKKRFTVCEGNYNDKCQTRTIPVGWKYIHGFAVPKFDVSETYTVVKGDNLTKIAKKTGTNWKDLAAINGIKAPYTIYTGQTLMLK